MLVRRLVLVLSIVVCGSLAFAAAALAAGGGFGPGRSTFSSSSANATFGIPKGGTGPFVSISVNQGYNTFKPIPGPGQRIVTFSTMVLYTESDPTTGAGGFGCFIVPDADFVVSKGLQSATLNAVLSSDEACPGFGTPLGLDKNPIAFAGGGGGGGGGLNLPITLSVTWTGSGVVTTYQDRSTFQCLSLTQTSTSTFEDSAGSATASVSDQSGVLASVYADVSSSKGTLDISGAAQPPC